MNADFTLTGTFTKYICKQIEIRIEGSKRVISFSDLSASDENIANAKTPASVQNSELLQKNTTFDGIAMSEIIKSNIKKDYKKGISDGQITIPCIDYFDINGRKAKDWAKGDMVETHDIISADGDNSKWRVTGRNFRKEGVAEVDLQVQQVKE